MRVALYCRVSTSDQNIGTQLSICRDYCQRMGFAIVDEYCDEGFSGKDDRRPAFERFLSDLRRGLGFEGLVTYKIDRLARSTLHLANLVEEFKKHKLAFVSVTQAACNTTTPEGKFFFDILAAVAELERAMIVARTRDGLARAVKQGKKLGRPVGSRDKRPRRKSGYLLRWAGNGRGNGKQSSPLEPVAV